MVSALLLALWLGILTSISPCPLASNIAALSFITRELGHTRRAIAVGVFYAAGRSITYVLIALIIVEASASVPHLSLLLQTTVTQLLGPLFVLIGLFILGLVRLPFSGTNAPTQQTAGRLKAKGFAGAFTLGVLLALAFCPVSAALYFGSLIPLSIKLVSPLLLPGLYGIGTALPVLFFAVAVTLGTQFAAKAFRLVSALEVWGNRITGVLFIVLGVYFSLVHVFGVL